MAKARAITKRRKAVRNIRKITQTMQLIATARFAKCLQRATASKPYTEKITEMIEAVSGQAVEHPLLTPNGSSKGVVLAITSNRGLCGSYNSNVLRAAIEFLKKQRTAGLTTSLEMVGKKGLGYMKFLGEAVSESITDVEDKIAYTRVAAMAERYMQLYISGAIGRVHIVYMKFISVGSQKPVVVQLLPIERVERAETAGRAARAGGPDCEYSPPPEQMLARLIPETVKIRLYQYFNDAIVSEQVSRMVAMKAATDAAGDMIKFLTREYNRARQSQITMELADIVGGAEAVK